MSAHGPQEVFLLIGGIDLTGDAYSLTDAFEQINEETHPFGVEWEEHLPVGIGRVLLEQGECLYDDRASGFLQACQEAGETLQYVAYGLEGYTAGDSAVLLYGTYVNVWGRMAERDGLTMAKPTHTITGQPYFGQIVSGISSRSGATGDTESLPADVGAGTGSATILSSEADNEQITCAVPHGLAVNDEVIIAGHTSTPDINGYHIVASVVDDYIFTLSGVNITVDGTGGTVKRNPFPTAVTITSSSDTTERVLTAAAHGLSTGDRVLISGHSGSTPDINGYHTVTVVDADEFTMDDVADITVAGTGGTVRRVSSRTAVADLHLLALSLGGYTDLTIDVRHSDDASTWATADSFTAQNAAYVAERVDLTNLRRYVAIEWTFGGAGSGPTFTAFVGVGRG